MSRGFALVPAAVLMLVVGAGGAAAAKPGPFCASDGFAGTPYVRGVNCRHILVDGYLRRYAVYVPTNPAVSIGQKLPAVFVFHGSGGNGERFLAVSGWREQADASGLIAVFPTGATYFVVEQGRFQTKWNMYGLDKQVDVAQRPPGYPAGAPWPADDVSFTRVMLADLKARAKVDRRRVFVSGFSNGAGFCLRVAVALSDRFAAAACHAGALDVTHARQVVRRIPVYQTFGSRDEILLGRRLATSPPLRELPLDPQQLLAIEPLAALIDRHLTTFGLASGHEVTRGDGFTRLTYRKPRDRKTTSVYVFEVLGGLTHRYATPQNNPQAFSLAGRFWSFFRKHPAR